MKELLKGYINGYLCVKCQSEYALDTEGHPLFSATEEWEDMFGELTAEEIDSQLEPMDPKEIYEIDSLGIQDWILDRVTLFFVLHGNDTDSFAEYYEDRETAKQAAKDMWDSYTYSEQQKNFAEAGEGNLDECNIIWSSKSPSFDSLQELTGQEAGIVLYDEGNVIVCNWAQQCPNGGLPIMDPAGLFVLGWQGEIEVLEEEDLIDDIREALPALEDMTVLSDEFGDIPALFGMDAGLGTTVLLDKDGNLEPTRGKVYKVSSSGTRATVIAPEGWN